VAVSAVFYDVFVCPYSVDGCVIDVIVMILTNILTHTPNTPNTFLLLPEILLTSKSFTTFYLLFSTLQADASDAIDFLLCPTFWSALSFSLLWNHRN
jgi:hypothetical protein